MTVGRFSRRVGILVAWVNNNMASRLSLIVAATLLLAPVPLKAVCTDWAAAGRFADIDAATVVFEGTVNRIEPDVTRECAPDRLVFEVRRVWKGSLEKQYVLLQATGRGGCLEWLEQDTFSTGKSYIVFASERAGGLESMGCGLSRAPNSRTRKRLDDWQAQATRKR